jgi:hypothetical protein
MQVSGRGMARAVNKLGGARVSYNAEKQTDYRPNDYAALRARLERADANGRQIDEGAAAPAKTYNQE